LRVLQRLRGGALGHVVADPVGGQEQQHDHHEGDQQPARDLGHPPIQTCRCRTADCIPMTTSAVRALLGERMARHGLADRPCSSPVEAAARTTAVQAQDPFQSRLGVRARSGAAVDESAVSAAIERERSVVRTWLMRGTIHLVTAADVRWLVRLVGPAVQRKFATRWQRLGLTPDVVDRCVRLLPEILADGPRTRAEVRAGLAERGLTLDSPDPQVNAHALVHASSIGLVCRGPARGRTATFVLLDDWLPDSPAGPSGDDALAELARRYFAAFSPATVADFVTWSGLAGRRAIELIRDELTPVDVDGASGYRLGEVAPARGVRLLPAFDNYLIGYRDRGALLAPELHGEVYQGGWILPTVLRDGRVIGTWSLDRPGGRVRLKPFEPWPGAVQRAVDREVSDLARFLDQEVTIARS